jgi:hypothetical protein
MGRNSSDALNARFTRRARAGVSFGFFFLDFADFAFEVLVEVDFLPDFVDADFAELDFFDAVLLCPNIPADSRKLETNDRMKVLRTRVT